MPQPCLDRVHGYRGSRQEINQGSQVTECFFYTIFFFFLLLAVLGLYCCVVFSRCGERGLLSTCGARASHCGGVSYCRARALGRTGFSGHDVASVAAVPGL